MWLILVEELLEERGLFLDHATVNRWVIKVSPSLEEVFHDQKKPTLKSGRMDETSIKVKEEPLKIQQLNQPQRLALPDNIEDVSLVESEWIEKSLFLRNEKLDESLAISKYFNEKDKADKSVQANIGVENKSAQNGSSLNQNGSFEIIN